VTRGALIGLLALGVTSALAVIAGLLVRDENPTAERSPDTSGSTTTIPTFDVNRDGDIDYALIDDEVVAVPTDGDSSNDLEIWLPFAGTAFAAIVGGGALIAVARLNRAGGEQVAELAERLSRLEHPEEGDEA
jgi:hypothetical protein